MTLRWLLLSWLLATTVAAEDSADVMETFAPLASSLSAGDVEGFLKPIDRQMQEFGKLRENVSALIALFDITSSVELVSVDAGKVELDWYLELRSKSGAGVAERRRQIVTARIEKKRILSIAPIEFFAPKVN
jgi:hypothetical protein